MTATINQPPERFAHLTFRRATNEDREQVANLIFGVLLEFGLTPSPDTTDADLKDIEKNYLTRGGLFELIENRGGLIGTVGLYPIDGEVCELRKMYLLPQARGTGLGKYILERTVDQARRLGFRKIVLETSSKLEAAIQLYRSFGFGPTRLEHPSSRADQAYELNL